MTHDPNRPANAKLLILGAGIGGCFAAAALSPLFAETLVIDRDVLPDDASHRAGVPQGSHIHAPLRQTMNVACSLFPGIEDDLERAGAIRLSVGDEARFHDAGEWHPKRDVGFAVYAQSRPLLEHVLRRRAAALPCVAMRDRTSLSEYSLRDGRVRGAVLKDREGRAWVEDADLVIDATGRSGPITSLLKRMGLGVPATTEMGVGIGYTSAYFTRDPAGSQDLGGYVVRSNPPNTRSGVLWPIESDRWVVSLSGRFDDFAPTDDEGFLAFARTLEDDIVARVIEREIRVGAFSRFNIPRIYWRHYERMANFPDGLVPIGDTISGFNPVYGQGMAVAAMHVIAVREALSGVADIAAAETALFARLRTEVATVTEAAWSMSGMVDLIYPQTVGERPADFDQRLARWKHVRALIRDRPDVQATLMRVTHLLEPASALARFA